MPANEFSGNYLEDALALAAASLGVPKDKIRFEVVREVKNPDPDLCEVTIRVNNVRRSANDEDTSIAARLARSQAEKRAAQDQQRRAEEEERRRKHEEERRRLEAERRKQREEAEAKRRAEIQVSNKSRLEAFVEEEDEDAAAGGAEEDGEDAGIGFAAGEDDLETATPPPAANEEPEPTEMGARAAEFINGVLQRMNFAAVAEVHETKSQINVRITGDDTELLAGRKAFVAASFQFLLNKILNRKSQGRKRIYVDVQFKAVEPENSMESMARELAVKAQQLGKTLVIAPMNPRDRRAIHQALEGSREAATRSDGNGARRILTVVPRNPQRQRP